MATPNRSTLDSRDPGGKETLAQKAERMMEDPFGSMIAGLVAPAAALGVALSAMFGLALVW